MDNGLPLDRLKASVVVRCRNEARTLRELLDLLFEQTEMGFELIIVDHNSTDGTLRVLEDFPVATIVQIPDDQFSHAYSCNLGMYVAQTNLVVLTNGHCLPVSRAWLEDGLSNFNDEKVAAVGGYYRSRRDGSKWEKLRDICQADTLRIRRHNQPISTTNAIIRRDLWKKYPFDESLLECEDYDWSQEMLARKFRTVIDPRFNVYHSHRLSRKQLKARSVRWAEICLTINERRRPREVSSKVFSDDYWRKTKTKLHRPVPQAWEWIG